MKEIGIVPEHYTIHGPSSYKSAINTNEKMSSNNTKKRKKKKKKKKNFKG